MSKYIPQLQIPPNRAKIAIKGTISTVSEFSSDLKSSGLTAADFAPIDWRKKINLVHVKNQGDCGDCWAQSSSSALSDRFMIQKNIQNLDINAAIVTQCAASSENQGCNGDNPYDAGEYFASTGGVNTSALNSHCPSWASLCVGGKGCTNLPTCEQLTSECIQAGVLLYKTIPASIKSTAIIGNSPLDVNEDATILNMKRHLLDGPYPVCFFVPNDFYGPSLGYKWEKTNGVYINGMYNDDLDRIASSNIKSSLGISDKSQWGDIIMEDGGPAGHAVELVGWGMENAGPGRENIPCWYIKNSWGPSWNESGYFRMAMNDFSTTNQRYNSLLGLDIPVSSVTQQSSGKVLLQENSLFGSGTVFDPDTSSGDPSGTVLSKKSSTTEKIVFWGIIGLLVVVSGIILYRVLKK